MSEEQRPYQTGKALETDISFYFQFMQLKEDNITEFMQFFKEKLECYNYICNYDEKMKQINVLQKNRIEGFETVMEVKINPDEIKIQHEYFDDLVIDMISIGKYLFIPNDTRLCRIYSIVNESIFDSINYRSINNFFS